MENTTTTHIVRNNITFTIEEWARPMEGTSRTFTITDATGEVGTFTTTKSGYSSFHADNQAFLWGEQWGTLYNCLDSVAPRREAWIAHISKAAA